MHKKPLEFKRNSYFYGKHTFKLFHCLIVFYLSVTPIRACKLWAVVSKAGIFSTLSSNDLQNINSQLNSLFDQSASMMDGWSLLGYSGFDSNSLALIQRSSITAKQDSTLYWSTVDSLLGNSASSIALGHLRMASSGAISIPNPHPWIFYFNEKPFSLIHNGTVNKNILYNLITNDGSDESWLLSYPPDTFGGEAWNIGGWSRVIDSQLIMLLIMQEFSLNGNDLISALQTSFSKLINEGIPPNQLNIIVSDSEILYAFGGEKRLYFKESVEHFSIMTSPNQNSVEDWYGIDSHELLKFSPVGIEIYPNFVSNENEEEIILFPQSFTMESAYPNPFNSGVNFSVTSSKTGPVLISIFSLNGRLVTKFSSFVQKNSSRTIHWSPSSNISTGNYIVLAESGAKKATQKILFIK